MKATSSTSIEYSNSILPYPSTTFLATTTLGKRHVLSIQLEQKHLTAHPFLNSLGVEDWFSSDRYSRYKNHFGKLNYQITIADNTLVFIDAPGFADEEFRMSQANQNFSTWKPISGGTLDFITNFKQSSFRINFPIDSLSN